MIRHSNHKIQLGTEYVQALRKFYSDLKSDVFQEERKRKFESFGNVVAINQAGILIVRDLVYDYPDPGTRTYKLWLSIKAASGTHKNKTTAQIVLYSDPAVAEAKLNPGFSYAAFFINPLGFSKKGTFIKPRGALAPSNYRPFFYKNAVGYTWEKMMEERTTEMGVEATEKTILELQPDLVK